jgi:hypothetical protein
MPRFKPNKYSQKVPSPIIPTRKAKTKAMLRLRGDDSRGINNHKDIPERTKARAVLAFTVTSP